VRQSIAAALQPGSKRVSLFLSHMEIHSNPHTQIHRRRRFDFFFFFHYFLILRRGVLPSVKSSPCECVCMWLVRVCPWIIIWKSIERSLLHTLNREEGKRRNERSRRKGKRKRGGEKKRKKKSQSFDPRRRECVEHTHTRVRAVCDR
jgi:hypothetical protein